MTVPLARRPPLQLCLGETEGPAFPLRAAEERCLLVRTGGVLPSVPDFDECTVYGTCSQTCSNTEGSYTCSCVEGYLLQPDNRSCKAKNGESLDRRSVFLVGSSADRCLVYPCPQFSPSGTLLRGRPLSRAGLHVTVLFLLVQKGPGCSHELRVLCCDRPSALLSPQSPWTGLRCCSSPTPRTSWPPT